jgi:peptidoglycan-N-acetylglucosamine deacetylase
VSGDGAAGGGSSFRVALTFDAEHPDRPTEPGVTAAILDVLAGFAVPAAFFVQGRWAESEPSVARRIAEQGHLVGNHSHHHARMTLLSRGGIDRDVRAAERAIREATGVDPRPWFRCPFGAGAGSARVIDRLARLGYRDVGWHVDGRDWAGRAADSLAASVAGGVKRHRDGTVVLLHAWPTPTPLALPAVINDVRRQGGVFVRLDELDELPGRRASPAVASPNPAR